MEEDSYSIMFSSTYSDTAIEIEEESSSPPPLYTKDPNLPPQLLLESAANESCCIFRIPDSLAEINQKAYKPKVVSIGPYHHGEKHLVMIEQHKPRFLRLFIENARKNGVERDDLYGALSQKVREIHLSFSEELKIPRGQLLDMMLLDGCFILMLLLTISRNRKSDNDPIFTIPWILPSIRSDLLLLENQVPFFVLQTLFEKSKMGLSGDLNRMVFDFFKYGIDKPEKCWVKHRDLKPKHLLDLIRMTFMPKIRTKDHKLLDQSLVNRGSIKIPSSPDSTSLLILSAKRLRLQGIKFRVRRDADSILDIKLKKNRLQIPLLRLDGFISSIFLNCVAFEQFYTKSSNDITSYVVFMGCLLNSEEDANFLSNDKRIIENYFGSESEVAQFFKTICKDVVFDLSRSYLLDVFEGVNKYTSKWYNGLWAGFRHTHFESPWTFLSSSAVVSIIYLTVLQATFAILSYLNDKKGGGNAAPPPGLL